MSPDTDHLPSVADRRKMLEASLRSARAQGYGAEIDLAILDVQEAGDKEKLRADLKNTLRNVKASVRKLNEMLAALPEDPKEEE